MLTKLIVHTGGMYSGKSTALISEGERYVRANKKVVFIKPKIDRRYSDKFIVTHSGIKIECIEMSTYMLDSSLKEYDVVLIDEIQFFDENIVDDIEALIRNDITVIADGLDMDFQGKPFKTTTKLMGLSDEVIKHKAVCEFCGEDANLSLRTAESKEEILIGEKESYKAVCRKCFKEWRNK